MEAIAITANSKKERYEELLPQITSLIEDEPDLIANMANVSAALKTAFSAYSWVGFYFLKQDELVLGPFQGKVACVRIKTGSGVCGTAAGTKKTIIVPDVTLFPGHIACDPDSKSEIVVPLMNKATVFGVLDVDSSDYGTFDETDALYLGKISGIIVAKFIRGQS